MKGKKGKSFKSKILLIAVFIILVLAGGLVWFINNQNEVKEINSKGYVYKVRYDFGTESYIYLLPDDVLKVVQISPIYQEDEACDCYEFTGEYRNDEEIIDFSDEAKEAVIEVIEELYRVSGKREFNADDMNLTDYQDQVLLAVMLNSEDKIILEG